MWPLERRAPKARAFRELETVRMRLRVLQREGRLGEEVRSLSKRLRLRVDGISIPPVHSPGLTFVALFFQLIWDLCALRFQFPFYFTDV